MWLRRHPATPPRETFLAPPLPAVFRWFLHSWVQTSLTSSRYGYDVWSAISTNQNGPTGCGSSLPIRCLSVCKSFNESKTFNLSYSNHWMDNITCLRKTWGGGLVCLTQEQAFSFPGSTAQAITFQFALHIVGSLTVLCCLTIHWRRAHGECSRRHAFPY